MKKQKKTNWWNALKLFFEWNGKKWDWNGIAQKKMNAIENGKSF